MGGIVNQLKVIFDSSEQPVYLYLDDNHWVCNKRFSDLLGYKSPKEAVGVEGNMLDAFVDEKSQGTLVKSYRNAMEKMVGSTIEVTWRKKSGGTITKTVIMVPIAYNGHLFAHHFLS